MAAAAGEASSRVWVIDILLVCLAVGMLLAVHISSLIARLPGKQSWNQGIAWSGRPAEDAMRGVRLKRAPPRPCQRGSCFPRCNASTSHRR